MNFAIVALSRRQHGLVTRGQLLELGVGESAIASRCRRGRLFRVHLGVYAVGRPPMTPVERAAAAVLACGPGAALSHASALALWGLDERWSTPLHVTVPRDRRRPAIAVHRARGLARTDLRVQLGIRVTSPARTMLDCALDLTERRLGRLVADARLQGLLHLGQLVDMIGRFPYHPGAGPSGPRSRRPALPPGRSSRTRSLTSARGSDFPGPWSTPGSRGTRSMPCFPPRA